MLHGKGSALKQLEFKFFLQNLKRSLDEFDNEENQKPKRQCLSVLYDVQNSASPDDIVTKVGTENQAGASPSDTEPDTKQNVSSFKMKNN